MFKPGEIKKRVQETHLQVEALRSDVQPTPDHLFTAREIRPALIRLFSMAPNHAGILDNLATEATSLNTSLNEFAENALHNSRFLVLQLRDEAKMSAQQVAAETATKAPETVTVARGTDIFSLRSELSSYDESIRAKMS